jgi:hypothetical protein
MILYSEADKLKLWVQTARRGGHRLPIVDYHRLLAYRPFCSCKGCIGPCLLVALKEGLLSGTTSFKQIQADWSLC